ncbi:MAG: hyperosmotically inducible periplasmic protein [Clostridia bacterium]|nr:hyperosmotically inducible periplasmic protein [Clostridia bacterium]
MRNKTSDEQIRQQVKSLLEKDKNLSAYSISADVVEGEIQLQGIVDTLKEKQLAEKIVKQVPQVRGVANGISISTDGAAKQEDVEMEVQEELEAAPNVNLHNIGIGHVNSDGEVILKGTTDNPSEIKAAQKAASKARGVTKIINQVNLGTREPNLENVFHSQVNNDTE